MCVLTRTNMDGCLFFICMPYPCSLKVNQHQGSCTLRSSHMILLPCRLAGSKPKQLTRPYVVEKREAGLERYGTAWPQTLLCLALSRLPTHPSHTRHPVLQYLCCLFVCVYIYLFFRVISESVFSLSLHWLSTSAVTLAVRTR